MHSPVTAYLTVAIGPDAARAKTVLVSSDPDVVHAVSEAIANKLALPISSPSAPDVLSLSKRRTS